MLHILQISYSVNAQLISYYITISCSHFALQMITFMFSSFETARNISLHPLNDNLTEENEDFALTFLDSFGGIDIESQHRSLQITGNYLLSIY